MHGACVALDGKLRVDLTVWPLGATLMHMTMNACMTRHNDVQIITAIT